MSDRPELSIVVIFYNIVCEESRTLLSLSTACQWHIDANDHDVIVGDIGSDLMKVILLAGGASGEMTRNFLRR